MAGEGIRLGDELLLFSTEIGHICPLICDDFRHEAVGVGTEADFIVVPSNNPERKDLGSVHQFL